MYRRWTRKQVKFKITNKNSAYTKNKEFEEVRTPQNVDISGKAELDQNQSYLNFSNIVTYFSS